MLPSLPPAFRRWCLASVAALAGVLLAAIPVAAERLPLKTYTSSDGLAHDRVQKIVRDSRGFLWFCTAGGLSRFDGRRFVSYSAADGLPIHTLNDLIENRDGSYWIATNGSGLVRYDPSARLESHGSVRQRFTVFPVDREPAANRVNVLYRDRAGRLWIGTDAGLFGAVRELPQPAFHRIPLNLSMHPDRLLQIWALVEDADGNLWIGTSGGLIRRAASGHAVAYPIRPARGSDHVLSLMVDSEQRLWIGHDSRLLVTPLRDLDTLIERDSLSVLPLRRVLSILRSFDGHVRVASDSGIHEFTGEVTRAYGEAQGLDGSDVRALAEDAYGNIWIATAASGATRIARDGLTTYTAADGLDHEVTGMLFETRNGQFCAVSRGSRINVFDGRRFRTIVPRVALADARSESAYALVLHDRSGEWWIPSGSTLYRFPSVARPELLESIPPKAVYSLGGGPASRGIWRLFEDSRGDVWIARRVPSPEVLTRLERTTGTLHRYSERDGLPLSVATTFAEDRNGDIWIGFWDGGMARYRDGVFEIVSTVEIPIGPISTLYFDRANRLWCGTADGVVRIENPGQADQRLVRYSTQEGLSSNAVATITEDEKGRLYVGTRRGVDRLDAASGEIRHFSTADGLAALEIRAAHRDRHGSLWFATGRGLSRLMPGSDIQSLAPDALLQSVRVDGIAQPLPDLGAATVAPITAPLTGSRIEIDFFALSFEPGERLKYQYRLGPDDPWSPPTDLSTLTYPRLSPGTYRFSVRAVRADGAVSRRPAELTFTIPPPIWARWWFLAAAATGILLIVHTAYRYRLARFLEIERLRTRLAMDLHDDIGSTLSQVAVLSEVARKRAAEDRRQIELLDRIASISRQLIDAMSDVVWAINPERDSLRDLLQRMRRFASDALEAQNIQLRFDALPDDPGIRLDAHVRREVFLIFKEGIHNLLRYAKCTRADVSLRLERGGFTLTIADNGIGVNPLAQGHGLGTRSMRERAERLGGDLAVSSAPGMGTVVSLIVPIGSKRHRRLRQ